MIEHGEAVRAGRQLVAVVALVLSFSQSCARGTDRTTDPFLATPPLAQLPGVVLGMSLREVMAVRPRARPESMGLRETADSLEIRYFVPQEGKGQDFILPDSTARITGVEYQRVFASDSSAVAYANSIHARISERLALPAQCRMNVPGWPRTRYSTWQTKGGTLYLRQGYADSVRSNLQWRQIPPSVTTGVLAKEGGVVPWMQEGAFTAPC